jgi:hypothetical protein
MITNFYMIRDINGYNGFGLPFSNSNYSATITGAATTLTVPSNTTKTPFLAVFSFEPGAAVWVALNNTATLPAGATLVATNSVLNPAARWVEEGDVLSFITSGVTAIVGVTFYAIPG